MWVIKGIESRIGVFYIALSYTSCLAVIRFFKNERYLGVHLMEIFLMTCGARK